VPVFGHRRVIQLVECIAGYLDIDFETLVFGIADAEFSDIIYSDSHGRSIGGGFEDDIIGVISPAVVFDETGYPGAVIAEVIPRLKIDLGITDMADYGQGCEGDKGLHGWCLGYHKIIGFG
jgi:hypothetical protein